MEIEIEEFSKMTADLLKKLGETDERTFSFPNIEKFLFSINVQSLKSKSQNKRDITIVVHDIITGFRPTLGFSIKSQLGSPSTLLNPSKSTNFIYKISNLDLDDVQIKEINEISTRSKIKDKVSKINALGGILEFVGIENDTFQLNLQLIDSSLPIIISHILLLFFKGKGSTLNELIELLNELNPCGFQCLERYPFYEHKIKRLLMDIALGMKPASSWDGDYDATGGYIIVKQDGDVLCYHIYNINEFQVYLLENTKLDSPSSNRYGYGKIYKYGDSHFFKLNLQIRFQR